MAELSPWQRHVVDWKDCTKCHLHRTRSRVVLARGSLPCDVLFVGEGPGKNEDAVGLPFVGPSGRLLNDLIDQADLARYGLSHAVTNVVACIPWDELRAGVVDPEKESIEACRPRLLEMLILADPRAVVSLGTPARRQLEEGNRKKVPLKEGVLHVHLVHPAAILKANLTQQEQLFRGCLVQLTDLVEKLAGVR